MSLGRARTSVATPAAAAFAELERMVRLLGEELAFFRRRALEAERRWKEATSRAMGSAGDGAPVIDAAALIERVGALESENAELRARLAEAAERARGMAERVRFLRQQEEVDG